MTNSTPFATVVIAGHLIGTGAFCECEQANPMCACDPGETPMRAHRGNRAISDTTDKDVSSIGEAPTSDFDFGTGAMFLALIVFAWTRYRM